MSDLLLLGQLRYLLECLRALNSVQPSVADKKSLRDLLTSTIKTMH